MHAIAYGECLGGALYWNDFSRLARNAGAHCCIRHAATNSTTHISSAGFLDQRLVDCREIDVHDADLVKVLGGAKFYSATFRLWKVAGVEDACEDYGQAAVYNGTCPSMPHSFVLDLGHTFANGQLKLVCGNTALMLANSRLSKYFNVIEGSSTRRHFGIFAACGISNPFDSHCRKPSADAAAPCCGGSQADGGG
jgi:arsenite methyltransferase